MKTNILVHAQVVLGGWDPAVLKKTTSYFQQSRVSFRNVLCHSVEEESDLNLVVGSIYFLLWSTIYTDRKIRKTRSCALQFIQDSTASSSFIIGS